MRSQVNYTQNSSQVSSEAESCSSSKETLEDVTQTFYKNKQTNQNVTCIHACVFFRGLEEGSSCVDGRQQKREAAILSLTPGRWVTPCGVQEQPTKPTNCSSGQGRANERSDRSLTGRRTGEGEEKGRNQVSRE